MLQKIILIFIFGLLVACAGPPPPGHTRTSGFYPTPIILKDANNQYVRLNNEPPYYLIADAQKSKADTFYLCELGHNLVALKARDQYVSVFLPSKNQAILRQDYIDLWEKLTLEKHEDLISFKACNESYLQANNDHILAASSSTLSDSCLFQMIEL